eukprot:COSAG02_NODE_36191_length_458_cov_0.518106_2_plen_33_part_01
MLCPFMCQRLCESDVVALPTRQRCKNLYKWCRN